MKIEISEEGVINCDGLVCDPLGLYMTCSECGSCPIIALYDKYLEKKFGI